eukprot:GILJ01008149.1.p1 GENE.GILJ01008149.1~~GILJ01008149.1.p1  ORF type:complete len:136 (+),score=19.45 GILJ01008149.1:44-451(+)
MPPKKKAGKKGGKKKKKAPASAVPAVPAPPLYAIPVLKPNTDSEPRIKVNVKLAAPVSDVLDFTFMAAPNTGLFSIRQKIIQRHRGAVEAPTLCLNRFHPDHRVSVDNTLKEVGVTDGECTIYYDFLPIVHPLLS